MGLLESWGNLPVRKWYTWDYTAEDSQIECKAQKVRQH